jgi:hypothetical protein
MSSFDRKVFHRHRGFCVVTDACMQMQRTNPDHTSMFVEHEGETIEVTKALVSELDFMRANGECICDWCKRKYDEHPNYRIFEMYGLPQHEVTSIYTGLHQLCDGRVIKT